MADIEKDQIIKHKSGHDAVRVRTPDGRSKLAILLEADDIVEEKVQRHVHGFAEFLREYSVVGLAVGFVAGSQVAVVIKQLLASFLTPVFQLYLGKDLNQFMFRAHFHGRSAIVGWGAFLYSLINFIFILIVIYAAIKLFKLDRFQKKDVATKGKKK